VRQRANPIAATLDAMAVCFAIPGRRRSRNRFCVGDIGPSSHFAEFEFTPLLMSCLLDGQRGSGHSSLEKGRALHCHSTSPVLTEADSPHTSQLVGPRMFRVIGIKQTWLS